MLVPARARAYSLAMFERRILVSLLAVALALPAAAQTPKPTPTPAPAAKTAGPKQIGRFGEWTAATHQESGGMVCYAFTRAQSSTPRVPGRGEVVLTVSQRASGRDAVAIAAGFTYAANAAVTVQVDQTGLDFYTAQRNAFARDGKAAVAAFQKGTRAIARSPGPSAGPSPAPGSSPGTAPGTAPGAKDAQVTDTFSLSGFSDAYKAIVKECPPR